MKFLSYQYAYILTTVGPGNKSVRLVVLYISTGKLLSTSCNSWARTCKRRSKFRKEAWKCLQTLYFPRVGTPPVRRLKLFLTNYEIWLTSHSCGILCWSIEKFWSYKRSNLRASPGRHNGPGHIAKHCHILRAVQTSTQSQKRNENLTELCFASHKLINIASVDFPCKGTAWLLNTFAVNCIATAPMICIVNYRLSRSAVEPPWQRLACYSTICKTQSCS